jgi:hypothetical protein
LTFLGRLEKNRHVVMLYDDDKYADLIITRYFTDGFKKGESCVFLTDEDSVSVRRRLVTQGIRADSYEKEKRLRIFKTPSPAGGRMDVVDMQRAMIAESTRGMKGPFRFVGRTIPDTRSVEGMRQGMNFEKVGNDHFDEFGVGLLCFYDIREMEPSRREEWVRGLLENHQSVVYASAPRKSVAFETSLLEEC